MKKLEFYATQELGKQHSIDPDNIEKIYYGGLHCCACGCEGTYTYPSDLVEFGRLLKVFESSTKDYDATYYDGDLNNIFEIETKEGFGIRLYLKKKGE